MLEGLDCRSVLKFLTLQIFDGSQRGDIQLDDLNDHASGFDPLLPSRGLGGWQGQLQSGFSQAVSGLLTCR
eukprot:m.661710 g.661710  ORF g.661710 m.661710 type:complete len:71 (-) comp58467_c1_seq8:222-434(-)